MNKSKYIPYVIIGVLIIAALVFVSSKLKTKVNTNSGVSTEEITTDTASSPMPVSEVNLNDKSSTRVAIDAELDQMDKELSGMNDSELDETNLSDDQLGL